MPYVPAIAWFLLFPSLGWYGIFVVRASEHPWLPYVMGLAVFSLVWMLVTLFLPWPKPRRAPRIWRHLRWPGEATPPEEIMGRRVLLKLVKPFNWRKTSATIHGFMPAPPEDHEEEDGPLPWEEESVGKQDRLYSLLLEEKLGNIDKEGAQVLFHPGWVEFKRGVKRRLRSHYSNFSYRPSVEDLLLNPQCRFKAIVGWVYRIQNPNIVTKSELQWSDVTTIGQGRIYARP